MSAEGPARPEEQRRNEQEGRQIFSAHMTPEPGPTGENPVSELLAEVIRTALGAKNEQRTTQGKQPLPRLLTEGLPSISSTAVGAVEGILKGKSLDGALKEAEIVARYAEAREKNANAEKAEAEAEQARIVTARERLSLVIDTFRALGVDPVVALTQSRQLAVLLGAGLSTQLPQPALPPQIAAGSEPVSEGNLDEDSG